MLCGQYAPTVDAPARPSGWRRFGFWINEFDVPARIRPHGFLGIAVPVDDVVIAHEADDGASAVQLINADVPRLDQIFFR